MYATRTRTTRTAKAEPTMIGTKVLVPVKSAAHSTALYFKYEKLYLKKQINKKSEL
jgi:hypothetical protein